GPTRRIRPPRRRFRSGPTVASSWCLSRKLEVSDEKISDARSDDIIGQDRAVARPGHAEKRAQPPWNRRLDALRMPCGDDLVPRAMHDQDGDADRCEVARGIERIGIDTHRP